MASRQISLLFGLLKFFTHCSHLFWQGHEGRFSVYVHASKQKPVHFSRYFVDREIRSDKVNLFVKTNSALIWFIQGMEALMEVKSFCQSTENMMIWVVMKYKLDMSFFVKQDVYILRASLEFLISINISWTTRLSASIYNFSRYNYSTTMYTQMHTCTCNPKVPKMLICYLS